MSVCPDCLAGEHQRSECPAYLPCPYWADDLHCFEVVNSFGEDPVSSKACACGATVNRLRELP